MPIRNRRVDRAIAIADNIAAYVRDEIRRARIAAGLSQDDVASAVGLSGSQVGRFERGELDDIGIEQLCRRGIAVGLVPSLRLYPHGDPVRDVAQVRLLARLRSRISPGLRWRVEVPLHGRHDPRAWDTVLDGSGCADAVEAETRIEDLQATERRSLLKLRDDSTIGHLILLVADTRANRRALDLGREMLRAQFPLDTRSALASLSAGRCPGANAIVIL
jgi:DNA-binding XRE family transcriptional regulator